MCGVVQREANWYSMTQVKTLLKNGGDIFGQKHSDRKRHIPGPRCRNIEKSLEVEQREVDGVYQVS